MYLSRSKEKAFHDPELDLVYYNYRHYSPALGRWLSRDPIEEQGGLNLYAFVGNRMISKIDFLGFATRSCDEYSSVRNCKNGVCEGRSSKQGRSSTSSLNGCGPLFKFLGIDWGDLLVPDFAIGDWALFRSACNAHDTCYATCGSDKNICDASFYEDMVSSCENAFADWNPLKDLCRMQAYTYHAAVSSLGTRAHDAAQDEHCLWESCCEE